MKKWFLLSIMLGAFALPNVAQDDDMYFVPSKRHASHSSGSFGTASSDTYYSGSSRSVDDYNRRWASSYEVLPADTSDVISFSGVEGVYPDSLSDFALTQRMTRWDGYEPSTAYWEGYAQGRRDYIGWHSPWYYSSYYPWYDSWYWDSWYYDPWYYSSWYYDPWYYGGWGWRGYYSYYYPHYYGWGGGGYYTHRSWPGTQNHGRIIGASPRTFASGRGSGFGGTRNGHGGINTRSGGTAFGGSRSGAFTGSRSGSFGGTRTRSNVGTTSSGNTGFNGSRSTQSSGSFSGSRSTGSSSGSYGGSSGGSFGGSRSGGGGARSGGGGGFGGSRRR